MVISVYFGFASVSVKNSDKVIPLETSYAPTLSVVSFGAKNRTHRL